MTEPARSLLGAEVFFPASKFLVSAALLAASTMRDLMAGRSILGGGGTTRGGKLRVRSNLACRSSSSLLPQLSGLSLLVPEGSRLRNWPEKSNRLAVTDAASPPVPVTGGTKGLRGGSLMF